MGAIEIRMLKSELSSLKYLDVEGERDVATYI